MAYELKKGTYDMRNRILVGLLIATLTCSEMGVAIAYAKAIKYEKTEVEKARGKCAAAIIGGALLGALAGRALSKKGAVAGAGVGAVAGAGACAIIMANAKKADRIIAAQIATAQSQDAIYTTTFSADDGSTTTFEGRAASNETIDAAQLRPVRYMTLDGVNTASPILAAGGQDCRAVDSAIMANNSRADLPTQYVCRTPEGDYQPYGVRMADARSGKKKAA